MSSTLLNRITLVLAFAGLFVAGVLSLGPLLNIVVPCGVSAGCETVQNHPSSTWFGVHVAYVGFAGYALLAVLAWMRSRRGVEASAKLVGVGYVVAAAGAVTSVGLTLYALTVIRATCVWCLASAVIMLATLVVYALLAQRAAGFEAPVPASPAKDTPLLAGLAIALVVSLTMMGVGMLKQAGKTAYDRVAVSKLKAEDFAPTTMHAIGPERAAVTVVEFGDLMCAACRTSYPELHKLQQKFPRTLRIAFRHYPLYDKPEHFLSLPAAFIAEYAAETGKFWQFLDVVYGGEASPSQMEELYGMAQSLGLDLDKLRTRIEDANDPVYARIQADLRACNNAGFMETPTFVVIDDEGHFEIANVRTLNEVLMGGRFKPLLEGPGK